MDITELRFCGSALRPRERPADRLPQVAVAGRSNVGKSSLLNWLFRQSLARVAKAPGKTRTLNFYLVNRSFYLVDLPGYGYAAVSERLREEWGAALADYIAGEERLAGVVALVDIRRGLDDRDRELQQLLEATDRARLVVLTKADRVGRGPRAAARLGIQRELGLATPPLAVSVRSGEGRRELLKGIDAMLSSWRERQRRE